jgi:hypothetical protein
VREAEIRAMQEANGRRSWLILSQFEFLKTRQEAFERVWKTSTFVNRLRWFWNPAALMKVVDTVHAVLLNESKRQIQEAAKKPKLTVLSGV